MSLRPLAIFPDPVLRRMPEDVVDFGEDLALLVSDLWESMEAYDGVGLAAPQIGASLRVAVVRLGERRYVLVNPRIKSTEGEQRGEEGCLSFPDIFEEVTRPRRVVVEAQDEKGHPYEIEEEDLGARALSHEIDHLHGKLLIDHLSPLKRESVRRRLSRRQE